MVEIGGFLEAERNKGIEYHNSALALNSGRNCLRYLLRYRKIEKIYIPLLLCSSVEEVCREENVKIIYYSIDSAFHIQELDSIDTEAWLYLVNYYGLLTRDYIKTVASSFENVILDNVHAFYEKPFPQVDTIYSCRKFFGVADGGYLYLSSKKKKTYEVNIEQTMFTSGNMEFLFGRMEKTASEYYDKYVENEKRIENASMAYMSECTHNILRGIDYTMVKKARENNFHFLNRQLASINHLQVGDITGPYSYPLLLSDGYVVREQLIKRKIYIPTLWKDVMDKMDVNSVEYQLSCCTLPIPCDQRYGVEEMQYVVESILSIV